MMEQFQERYFGILSTSEPLKSIRLSTLLNDAKSVYEDNKKTELRHFIVTVEKCMEVNNR